MLHSLFKKLSELKNKVQIGSKYDKRNVADKVRGQAATRMLSRIKLQFDEVIRSDIDLFETDLNKQASLEVGALNFLADARGPSGNLITLSIIQDKIITPAVNEQQLIGFSAVPDAGNWAISFNGNATSSLAFNAVAATIQTALRLLPGLSDVTVAGSYAAGFTVVFAGSAGGINQPLLVISSNTLTATAVAVVVTVTETVAGAPAVDTTSVVVKGNDIKIHAAPSSTNTQIKAQVDASTTASALISVTIDAGQGAVTATAISNASFTGGA